MKKSPSSFSLISIYILLLSTLVSIPDLCFASQQYQPDSTFVMAITHYKPIKKSLGEANKEAWSEKGKTSYISRGAIVNLMLADGREIIDVPVENVGQDYLTVAGEMIPFSEINQIKVGKTSKRKVSKGLGAVVIGFGAIVGIGWVDLYFNSFGGMDLRDAPGTFFAVLLIPIAIICLGVSLIRKYPRVFDLQLPKFSLSTVSKSSLSEKVSKKLSRRFYFF